MLKVMHKVSGKVRNQDADLGLTTEPTPFTVTLNKRFILWHAQGREYLATCTVEGHRWNGVEFLVLGFALLPILKEQSSWGRTESKAALYLYFPATPFPRVLAGRLRTAGRVIHAPLSS